MRMTLLSRHDPPAHLDDLDRIVRGRQQWHEYIAALLGGAAAERVAPKPTAPNEPTGAPRFYDAHDLDPAGRAIEVPILWNAFPKRLVSRFGRDKAMVLADMLWPRGMQSQSDDFDPLAPKCQQIMNKATVWERPQDEYCEWRVERDPDSHEIRSVVFTTESPEYWTALHTGKLSALGKSFDFKGDPRVVADLYTILLGRPVKPADLLNAHGDYDPWNTWNTRQGIVHLTHDSNQLPPEVMLCAKSSLAYGHPAGGLIAHADALCCAIDKNSVQVNRNSDPTIIGTLNALARRGAWLTLANPVGLSIDQVDTNGWELPGVHNPRSLLRTVRGSPGHILRLEVRVPHGSAAQLGQLTIAGEPLRHGGQIAECITVKAIAGCVLPSKHLQPATVAPKAKGYLLNSNRHLLKVLGSDEKPEAGWTPAFQHQPGVKA